MRGRSRRTPQIHFHLFLAAALGLFALTSASHGADTLRIELNKLEPMDTACRAYLLFENQTATDFQSLKLDLMMFDPEGIISRRLVVEGAPLPAGKTSVKLFDIDGVNCDAVSRVLLNGVLSCSDAQGEREGCLQLIQTATRSSAELFK